MHKTAIKSRVISGAELWTLTKKDENSSATSQRKVLRSIYGPKYTNGEWKNRTNEDIINMFNVPDTVSTIKSKRTEWLGHIRRMERDRGKEYLKIKQVADGEWEDQD
jgi:hypothetical protein